MSTDVKQKATVGPSLAALGIVFGDIGTSPLYSVKQLIFHSEVEQTVTNTLGAISLVVWLLTIVICIKYVTVVLRADNHEQGGVFALLALLYGQKAKGLVILSGLLVFGAGMLLGDGVITPAISVLSAMEGLSVASDNFKDYVVVLTLIVLFGLFLVQSKGTHKVGRFFGPIMLVWFIFLAVTGLFAIWDAPQILNALNPKYAIEFLVSADFHQLLLTVGSVILVVTGGEALFADLGHIGKRPIREAWLIIVFPALILNYLGQGARVIEMLQGRPIANNNIFFAMFPHSLVIPVVVLATAATVIASQALISGAFSLVSQGIALKYLPPMRIKYTNDKHENQNYIPLVNWSLFIGSVFLVVTFESSERLTHAYGLAVAIDMTITTLAVSAIANLRWKWNPLAVVGVFLPFFVIDFSLFLGNVPKIPSGGYVPLLIGLVMVMIMSTWKWGRDRVREAFRSYSTLTMGEMVARKRDATTEPFPRPMVLLTNPNPTRVDDPAPPLLELFYRRYGVFPRNLVLLTIRYGRSAYVDPADRYEVTEFENDPEHGSSFLSIAASFGFRENPNVEAVIADIVEDEHLPNDDLSTWLIHAGRERVVGNPKGKLFERLRFNLFKLLSRQAEPQYSYFGLDSDARLTVEYVPVKF